MAEDRQRTWRDDRGGIDDRGSHARPPRLATPGGSGGCLRLVGIWQDDVADRGLQVVPRLDEAAQGPDRGAVAVELAGGHPVGLIGRTEVRHPPHQLADQAIVHWAVDARRRDNFAEVELQLPAVRDGHREIATDKFRPVEVVAVGGGQEPRPIAAFVEDRVRSLDDRDARPVERHRVNRQLVTLHERLQPVVESADHERTDRREGRRIAAAALEALQSPFDGLRGRQCLRHRERHRGIDVHTAREGLLEGGDAGSRGRVLDLDVRGQRPEPDRLAGHPLGVAVVGRVDLDGLPALAGVLALVDRTEHPRAANGHLLGHRPGQLDLAPRRVLRGERANARRPEGRSPAQHLEDDDRVARCPGGAPLNGICELVHRARVVPVVRGPDPRGLCQRAVQRVSGDSRGLLRSPNRHQGRSHRANQSSCVAIRRSRGSPRQPCPE